MKLTKAHSVCFPLGTGDVDARGICCGGRRVGRRAAGGNCRSLVVVPLWKEGQGAEWLQSQAGWWL